MLACARDLRHLIKIKCQAGVNDAGLYRKPFEQMQLMKFDGEAWRLFGDVINGEVGH
jgi:hypothetical protein